MRIDILKCDICERTISRSEWDQCQDILLLNIKLMGHISPEDICKTCQLWIVRVINERKKEWAKQKNE